MQQPIQIGNFEYTKDDKGDWIYKSNPSSSLSKEKAQYREKPQYAVQEEIEGKSKDQFKKLINSTVLELIKYIKEEIN